MSSGKRASKGVGLRRITVFFVFSVAPFAAEATNLLTNPGFETGTTSGWSPFGCSLSAVTVPHSGSYSCVTSSRSGTWSGPSQSLLNLISDGQTCSFSAWVRLKNASSADVKITVKQVDNSTNYHFIGQSTASDSNWVNISGAYTFEFDGTPTQLLMYFEGPDPNVDFYVDDVSVVISSNGDWEAEANDRIEQIRKGDFRITVVSSDDPCVAVPDVNVQVVQTRHQFAFGSEISWPQMDNTRYLNFFKSHFEWGVMGNASKWYSNEPVEGYVTYQQADRIYDWCSANNIKMRGHCIFWAADSVVQDWVKALSYAPLPATSDLRTAVEDRLDSAVNHFKGKFLHWDVNNEMCTNHFFADRLGYSIRPWMFQAAHAIDPDCLLFLNDYNVINGGFSLSTYKQLADDLISQGAPIHALGVQCHMTTGFDPATIKARFDSVAEVNLPIWVTEFDVSEPNVNIRADEIEDFYRIAFSHPAVAGILMWGFWQDAHWREDACLVNSDWSLNAAGERYEALMDEWTTDDANVTDANGNADFRGFYGTYAVIVTPAGGDSEVHTIELTNSPEVNQFTLQIGTGTPADHNAPVLDPLTWLAPPQAVAADAVRMTAPEANDISGVEYYFNNVTDPNHDSGWQESTFYADSGLKPNIYYSYRFKARDESVFKNETPYSDAVTVLTPGSGGNIIVNSGFEAAAAIGWTTWGCDLIAVTDQAHSGNYSGLTELRTQSWHGFVQDVTDRISDGKTYQCSAWVRLGNSTGETVSMVAKQVDDGGTNYHFIGSTTAYDDRWTELGGQLTLDVNGTLENLSIYVSGPAPDVNFYLDDMVVKTDPTNCPDVQQFGFRLPADLDGNCRVDYSDLAGLLDQWLSAEPAAIPPYYSPDIYVDDEVDLADFAVLAFDWLNCNNPQDSNCISNWQE